MTFQEELAAMMVAEERKLKVADYEFLKRHREIMDSIYQLQNRGTDEVPRMVTIKEAAMDTGLSYDYIRKLCLQKKIVHVKAGTKYLVNWGKLVEFLNEGEKAAGE